MWTDEEIEYLKEICNGHSYKQIVELFCEKFGLSLTKHQLYSKLQNLKLHTNTNKIVEGHRINEKPIGSETWRTRDNCWCIKVGVKEWVRKHEYIYEQHYGPIPKNHLVIFADGDKTNFELDNLVLLSRREFLYMSSRNMFYNNKELTYTSINLARLLLKIGELKRMKKSS